MCPNCNATDHEEGARFCHVCGTKLFPNSDDIEEVANTSYLPAKRAFTVNGVSFNMILVEGGTFWMGAQNKDASFHEGLAAIKKDYLYGYIDMNGNIVIPCLYREAMPFREGLAAVRLNEKMGFIDKTGKMVIPPSFDTALNFSEGLVAVEISGRWRYIDKTGNTAF